MFDESRRQMMVYSSDLDKHTENKTGINHETTVKKSIPHSRQAEFRLRIKRLMLSSQI